MILFPWDFPGKNTGVGCHFLLWGIFPTQGSNPGLLPAPALIGKCFTAESPGKPDIGQILAQSKNKSPHLTDTSLYEGK